MKSDVHIDDGYDIAEYFIDPSDAHQILDNLRIVDRILDCTGGSGKFLGLSFSHINNLMKSKELIREVSDSLNDTGDTSFDSYDSRTYKKKRW